MVRMDVNGSLVSINEYYADNPDMLLGELAYESGRYGGGEVVLKDNGMELLTAIPKAFEKIGAGYTEPKLI